MNTLRTTFVLTLCLSSTALAGPHDCAIYATRIGGDAVAAQPYVDKFLRLLETGAGWAANSATGSFLVSRKDAVAYIDSKKPGVGLLEPALYFDLKKSHSLTPLAQVEGPDLVSPKLHVVVKDPALTSLASLKGKRLWTTLGDSPRYLSKVVLGGGLDAAADTQLKPLGQALKGVRGVIRGDCDATILDDGQLAQAKAMAGGAELRTIFTSAALPPPIVVAFGTQLNATEQAAVSKAYIALCGSGAGPLACKEMHIVRFVAVDQKLLDETQKRFGE